MSRSTPGSAPRRRVRPRRDPARRAGAAGTWHSRAGGRTEPTPGSGSCSNQRSTSRARHSSSRTRTRRSRRCGPDRRRATTRPPASGWCPATRWSTACCGTAGWAARTCTSPSTRSSAGRPSRTTCGRSGPPCATACWTASRPTTPGCGAWSPPRSPRGRVRELAPRIAELAGALVGDVLDAGSDGSPVDLVAVLAEPLPVTVIAELLGVPEADRWRLRPWSAAICRMFELDADRADGEAASAACLEFGDYLGRLAARRRDRPRRRPAHRAHPGRGRRRGPALLPPS